MQSLLNLLRAITGLIKVIILGALALGVGFKLDLASIFKEIEPPVRWGLTPLSTISRRLGGDIADFWFRPVPPENLGRP